ncbi:50S ribosomal protein L14e [Candidatus Woesearchaeota archaeon]|nr:50S ribosomal protein L14e [Candidatus Woesearchaeota archaeon]
MIEVGRLCVKIAGRDAGLKCVVVEVLDKNFVMIDGQTRRRKCNILHLEPLGQVVKIKAKATHSDVVSEFKKLNLEVKETKPRKAAERPKKARKKKEEKTEELAKKVSKAEKKKEKPAAKKEEKLESEIPNSRKKK